MKEQGSVLVAALLVTMLLLFLGGVLLRLTATELNISQRFSDGIAAHYAAEAGVKRALVEVDNRNAQNVFAETLKSGSYLVKINSGNNKNDKVITAVGKNNGAVRKAVAYVTLPEEPRFACFSGGAMVLNAKVTGAVGLRGTEITMNGGASIVDMQGSIVQPELCNSTFTLPQAGISLNEKSYANSNHLPALLAGGSYSLKGSYYVEAGLVVRDTDIIVPEGSHATIFVKGKAELAGNIDGELTIIAADTVTLKNIGGNRQRVLRVYAKQAIQVDRPLAGKVLLFSEGDVLVKGGIHGVVIAQGTAVINSPVAGSVLADKTVLQNGGGEITYDEHVFHELGFTRPRVTLWEF
jgi:hypothetical protein